VTAALRYEWVRISTVRSTRICLVLTLLLSALLGYGAANPHHDFDQQGNEVGRVSVDWVGAFAIPLSITVVLVSVVAAQSIGQEYRFGIIRLTLTAFPRRMQVISAKVVLVVLTGVVFALASCAGSWIGLVVRGYPTPPDGALVPDASFFLRGLAFAVLWALSAFALAGITRQTAIGIAVPIVSGVIVEQILAAVLSEKASWLTDRLPWSNAGRWSDVERMAASGIEAPPGLVHSTPVGWLALGVFAVWVLVFLVVETVLFQRRDA
jgi:ABC-2 type transport system permease protein